MTGKIIMMLPRPFKILMIGLPTLVGCTTTNEPHGLSASACPAGSFTITHEEPGKHHCVTPSGPFGHSHADCPPGELRIESSHGGRYTCVTDREYEEEMRRIFGDNWSWEEGWEDDDDSWPDR